MAAVKASFLRISGTLNELRMVASTAPLSLSYDSMIWQVPPADSIFSRADLEKPWACTVSALESSPRPSTLTGMPLRVARPAPRTAQLAHPHVDRVLAALEARAVLGAG